MNSDEGIFPPMALLMLTFYIQYHTVSMILIVLKLAFKENTVLLPELTISFSLVVIKGAYVHPAIGPNHFALAMHFVSKPSTFIGTAIRPLIYAFA